MAHITALGVFLLGLVVSLTAADVHHPPGRDRSPAGDECQNVLEHFSAAKIGPSSIVPKQRIHDKDMEVCYKGSENSKKKSCCSRRMERKYIQSAEKDFYDVIRSTSASLKNTLASNSVYYQDQFLRMISMAENRTEVLFRDVYKIPLKDQHGPLQSFFMDLQAYVKRREVVIHQSVEQFFDHLFPLVFHNLLNDPSVLDLDADYRTCLTATRQRLNPKPFGDIPRRLVHQLTRALFTARTYLESLSLGIEAINTTDHIILEPQCIKSLARLRYCSHCDGHLEARPCRNFCYNVMRGCLATTAEIDRHWNEFVDSIKSLTTYMKGSFNIEEVLRGLHHRLSEAIMHAMETGHKFYAKVITACGHPKTSKKTLTSAEPVQQVDPTTTTTTAGTSSTDRNPAPSAVLDERLETFMRSLMASKGFYHNLADTLCSAEKFATGLADQDHCWNGESVARYNKTLVEVDLAAQMRENPEMRVVARQSTSILTLIDKLMHVRKRLVNKISREMMQADDQSVKYRGGYYSSYSGDGTQIDDEDYNDGYSGSGQGIVHAGSGYEPPSRPRKPQRPGKHSYGTDTDIYLEEKPSDKPPTSRDTKPAGAGEVRATAPSCVPHLTLLVTSLLGLALWLNG